MSPRRKLIDDQQLARLAAELLVEQGPRALTFAQLAQRCGLAPATLVQRFGSKQNLFAAAAGVLRGRVVDAFGSADGDTQLLALQSALRLLAQEARTSLSAWDVGTSLELRKQISFALLAAVEAGELARCDVPAVARALQLGFYGAVTASTLEGGDVAAEVETCLAACFAEYI